MAAVTPPPSSLNTPPAQTYLAGGTLPPPARSAAKGAAIALVIAVVVIFVVALIVIAALNSAGNSGANKPTLSGTAENVTWTTALEAGCPGCTTYVGAPAGTVWSLPGAGYCYYDTVTYNGGAFTISGSFTVSGGSAILWIFSSAQWTKADNCPTQSSVSSYYYTSGVVTSGGLSTNLSPGTYSVVIVNDS